MRRTPPARLRTALAAALLLGTPTLLAGCGEEEPATPAAVTADNGDRINAADVAFATQMIPHHAQALQLVDLTVERDVSPELRAMAEAIREAQAPEIEQMSAWLTAWGEPVPETARDHVNAGHSGDDHAGDDHAEDHGSGSGEGTAMQGMLTAEQLDDLAEKTGADFEQAWAEAMVAHHEGAVEMARTQREQGRFPAAVELATRIERQQQEEISELEAL